MEIDFVNKIKQVLNSDMFLDDDYFNFMDSYRDDDEIINGERRRYLKSLQNIDQVFSRFYISILENKMMNMMSRH